MPSFLHSYETKMKITPRTEALAVADSVLTRKGRSFHWARRLLSPVHAARATRLYGFCRYLDDLADEATSLAEAQSALAAARVAIESDSADQATQPTLCDGLRLMQECKIAPEIVLELIQGIASDLEPIRMADEAELLRYAYRVAGTVGLMMCRVLDVTDPAAHSHAVDLGIAMQLTNICRDIAEDAHADRRYLPASLVGDLTPVDLIAPSPEMQPLLRRSVQTLLRLAEGYYRSGEAGLPFLPQGARSSILVAGRVYRAIGTQLTQRDFAYWEGRARVSGLQKAGITAHALITAQTQTSFWQPPLRHHSELHRALLGLPGITPFSHAD
jgi:15-cis-phytoene synthase